MPLSVDPFYSVALLRPRKCKDESIRLEHKTSFGMSCNGYAVNKSQSLRVAVAVTLRYNNMAKNEEYESMSHSPLCMTLSPTDIFVSLFAAVL